MASTREERLQMRQRGAGTHKVKNVDFGFSFGLPIEPAQHELPRSESQPEPTPGAVQQTQESVDTPDVSQTDQRATSRSPRSRNRFPERPSTFDIPVDDREELPRRKRRRISTTKAIESSPPVMHDEPENLPSALLATRSPPSQPEVSMQRDGVPGVDGRHAAAEQLGHGVTPPRIVSGLSGAPVAGGDGKATNETAVGSAARETETTPKLRQQPPPTSPRNRQLTGEHEPEPTSSPTRHSSNESPTQGPDFGNGQAQTGNQIHQKTQIQSSDIVYRDTGQDQQTDTVPSREPDPGIRRSDRNESISREAEEPNPVMSRKNRRKQRQKASRRTEDSRADRLQTPPTRESEQEDDSAEEDQTPEPEQDEETSQVERGTATATEVPKRRGRPPGAKNRGKVRANRQREAHVDDGSEVRDSEEPRQRGHTVAVTVHRLTNTRALAPDDSDVPSDSDDESSDELAAERRNAKFPSRNGVNPADVLNQICRETLEKTVTALNNGIANEANQQRRAEWIRKRKAVEAYGVELSNRLLELSELLDSNFALGVKLKKAKREVGELRNRLLEIRKQRQEIGVRMDAVRRKHQEEESAKMSRNAINNALHNLELALDRNQVRNTDEEGDDQGNPMAGLEFLVRSVSETVSSASPGAQGGLLNQVKAFNKQLEKTLKELER